MAACLLANASRLDLLHSGTVPSGLEFVYPFLVDNAVSFLGSCDDSCLNVPMEHVCLEVTDI